MCKAKTPNIPAAPAPRAMDRLPDRVLARGKASERIGYTPRYGQTAPGASRSRAPTAVLGATSTTQAPGVVLGG